MKLTERINFRQPKYMLPAIVYLPLLGASYFIFDLFDTKVAEKKDANMQTTEYLNPNLPQAHIKGGDGIGGKYENMLNAYARDAAAAIYVTNEALQKRYPSNGEMLGCSDVLLCEFDETLLENRKTNIKHKQMIRVGTAAFLDVKWKGQENVIKTLAVLKEKGMTNVIYELIGIGEGARLKKIAKQLGVEDQVKFLGAKNHDEVFKWIDNLDVYIQPSYQEGLCRSIVEAMSRACPVICSDIGGNYELIDRNYLFPCGDYHKLAKLIEEMFDDSYEQSLHNFEKSKKYNKKELDILRYGFLKKFIES